MRTKDGYLGFDTASSSLHDAAEWALEQLVARRVRVGFKVLAEELLSLD